MKQYLGLLLDVMETGEDRTDRTGVGTIGVFVRHLSFNLSHGFPILTTKKVNWKAVVEELRWFLSGSTNVRDLHRAGVHIWDEWSDAHGNLGPIYGAQLRGFNSPYAPNRPDQVQDVIDGLRRDPFSRRHIITTWNASDLPWMRLPPCHGLKIQFYINLDGRLDMHMDQRSADVFLGLPFNISSYALFLHLMARWTDFVPGTLYMTLGDVHLYSNHVPQAQEQLRRLPRGLPMLSMSTTCDTLEGFIGATMDDTVLIGYDPHPAIPAKVAV